MSDNALILLRRGAADLSQAERLRWKQDTAAFLESTTMTPDTTMHVILADFGKHGQAVVERAAGDCDLETTIRDLMSGQIENPLRVFAFNPAEAWASDVSEDIAREIAARREHLPAAVVEFIAIHAGEQLANAFREAA